MVRPRKPHAPAAAKARIAGAHSSSGQATGGEELDVSWCVFEFDLPWAFLLLPAPLLAWRLLPPYRERRADGVKSKQEVSS